MEKRWFIEDRLISDIGKMIDQWADDTYMIDGIDDGFCMENVNRHKSQTPLLRYNILVWIEP